MASSSAAEGMSITKGGSILVKVEDLTGELISVKLIDGDKIFRGILLQETIGKFNEYGTNLERITSAPFWPPLSATTSGINLKTIPCSTERYSYKLEGQPSNLNVFQPDPTKRSHRNQPAPQLSRILRPRRFVCRKCKKAFHLEEHGTELSSSFLTDLIDRRTCDSSALSSDNEVSHYLPKSNISDQITPAILNGNSQSIRHVTPPIIPKLNEEMKINVDDSSKSEIDSSSDIRSKSKKHFISEQSTKTPESLEPKLVMSKKRKVDVPDKQKLKRIKLSSQKLTEPNNVSNTVLVATPPVVNPDSSSDPALPSSFSEETKDFSTSPSLVDVPNTDNKIHQIVENSSKDTESPFTSEIIPESNISTTDSQDFDKTFSATHSELLTQFPHVFPDLKVSGILSDTVEIPTFSEDESEEEDAGRLIIDPDVMASVNVPLSTGNHHYITETLKQDPDVLREDLYSLSSDNMSYNHELSSQAFDSIHPYSRTSSTTLPQSSMSSFGNPVYSSDSFTHSFNSSTYSTECLISQPVSVYPTHNQSLIQTVLPSLTTTPLLASSTVSNLSVPSRSAYFQPSHVKVPSTTTHNVSYVTTEYSTL